MSLFYDTMLAISLVLSIIYLAMWHKHFDIHISLVFVLVPITNLGFSMFARATSLEEAIAGKKIAYIGGCFLLMFIMFMVFSLCHIKLSRFIRVTLMTISTIIYISVLSIGYSDIFYKKDMSFEIVGDVVKINKTYSFMHNVFVVIVITYFAMSIIATVYSYFRKNQVSRTMIYLLCLSELVAMLAYFAGKQLVEGVELLPAAYVFGQIMYLIIIYKITLYDISDTAIDSMVESGSTGFISFDFRFRYLGSNKTAKRIFPELYELTVDKPINNLEIMKTTALKWLEDFKKDNSKNKIYYDKNDKVFLIEIVYLFDGRKNRGYQFYITDDTKNQQYIKLIDSFNDELINEVAQKTAHIVEMHDKLILGMAAMVESRDNSTGGHIKRTSEGVKLLTDEMKKDRFKDLSDEFYKKLIKAAPMHDLGKIAVDDAILRKPGRFTDEEFAIMKTHAAEGAKIVHQILEGTEDIQFHTIAENVAHFHHERWDGSGYPDGLKGEEIPLEARIMAIADVYDALVSKRVYKEKMSFEQADKIIMEGMGNQFDKSLEPYYIKAKPKLEAYYSSIEC